ncbi:hypothetical protein GIB67_010029 [Kingdonia uniflora]|uniref:Uncharacterized protein n=1 Tax=Kingdonia uniflora TaxID=39325 RepID=A0A7J7KV49_9MAGN|nr:hypothetical protein GIB67_010029 [Kingdonia uniflora]
MKITQEEEDTVTDLLQSPHSSLFVEVTCTSSGKVRRFSKGTQSKFALQLINQKRGFGAPLASYIEAVKQGEEPVSFGDSSVLVEYGDGWKLQTFTDEGEEMLRTIYKQSSGVMKSLFEQTSRKLNFEYCLKPLDCLEIDVDCNSLFIVNRIESEFSFRGAAQQLVSERGCILGGSRN